MRQTVGFLVFKTDLAILCRRRYVPHPRQQPFEVVISNPLLYPLRKRLCSGKAMPVTGYEDDIDLNFPARNLSHTVE
jgi:hypothetical protein